MEKVVKSSQEPRKKRKKGDEEDEQEVVIMSIKNLIGGWEDLGPPPVVVRDTDDEIGENEDS